MGGLGLRSAADHAPTAHAVSFLAAQSLLDGLLGEDVEEPSLPQPLLEIISEKIGEDSTVETLTWVSQKMASLKVDLHNKSPRREIKGKSLECPLSASHMLAAGSLWCLPPPWGFI